jgi:hypothetical protein
MIKEDIQENILRVLDKYESVVLFAYLFGSTASAESKPSGDIDIAVFLAGGTSGPYFETKLSLFGDLCRALKRNDVDLVVLNTATNLVLLDEIVRTGLLLIDREPDARSDFELRILHNSMDFRQQRMAIMGV